MPIIIKFFALALLTASTTACIRSAPSDARSIRQQMAAAVWAVDSGVYSTVLSGSPSRDQTLVKIITSEGQRAYRDEKQNIYYFYPVNQGRFVVERQDEDGSVYDLMELYSSSKGFRYGLECQDIPQFQRIRTFGMNAADNIYPNNCFASSASNLLDGLSLSFQHWPGRDEATFYEIKSTLPDEN